MMIFDARPIEHDLYIHLLWICIFSILFTFINLLKHLWSIRGREGVKTKDDVSRPISDWSQSEHLMDGMIPRNWAHP